MELSEQTKFITNKNEVMQNVIGTYLPHSEKLDFLVGFFYFSGFESIYKQIGDKQMRILVGMEAAVDLNNCICEIARLGTQPNVESISQIRNKYFESLVSVINEADATDTKNSKDAFDLFINKVMNGTLEVRKTQYPNHAKMYLFYADEKIKEINKSGGFVLVGSSNFSTQGISDRHEINVRLKDGYDFKDASIIFEELWKESVPLVTNDARTKDLFLQEVVKKTWLGAEPTPYLMYVRALYEYFKESDRVIKTPSEITSGSIGAEFSDLQYQLDAIKDGIGMLKRHTGCIISDVVGLGKSIIASCIAANMGRRVIIISPPHLKMQWENYAVEFKLMGCKIYTSGKIEEAANENENKIDKPLIIIDEAHRYRNENTADYKFLHRLCAGNYVLLLTATPFNNRPSDIFSLIKLFQIPAKSSMQNVENLGSKMTELAIKYKNLKNAQRKKKVTNQKFTSDAKEITDEIKMILRPILIRRTRIDLTESIKYAEDLKQQGIEFADVKPPVEQTYELGDMASLYIETLEKLTGNEEKKASLIGAKYKPLVYLKNDEKIIKKYQDIFGIENFQTGQNNMATFMKQLIVRRFESSIYSFKMTVDNILCAMENAEQYYEKYGKVLLYKKANLPDFEELQEKVDETLPNFFDDLDEALESVLSKQIEKGLIIIKKEELNEQFIKDLKSDIALLKEIKKAWPEACYKNDPKIQGIIGKIQKSVSKEKNRKIIIFSEFSDTVDYLYKEMKEKKLRVLSYTSANASKQKQSEVRSNFDAGFPENLQKNDYDVLVATDAISEGFSLHRAGTIYNYDIPYNPTRVIQRVGRINRINKKVFDELNIYNFFPSSTGEATSHTKEISTFKMMLIQAVLGSDTKILTSEEQLSGYMSEELKKAKGADDEKSWDTYYKNELTKIKNNNKDILQKAMSLPYRCRLARKSVINVAAKTQNELFENIDSKGVIVFSKKGDSYRFAWADEKGSSSIFSDEAGFNIFKAEPSEEACKTTDTFYAAYEKAKKETGITKYKQQKTDNVRAAEEVLIFIQQNLENTTEDDKKYLKNCKDVISNYASLPVYVLKEIAALKKLKNPDEMLKELYITLPDNYIDRLMDKNENTGKEKEQILLAEQMI